jgi:polysaccharide biosynthesis protein PslH
MRILIVVDYFGDPPLIGTAVIAYHWARVLARRHEIELLCTEEDWQPGWDDFAGRFGVGRAPVTTRRRGRLAQALAPARGVPPSLVRFDAARLALDVAECGTRYDAAIVIGYSQARVARELRRVTKVLFVPADSMRLLLRRRRGTWQPLERLRWTLEAPLWDRVERVEYPRFDGVVFVNAMDAAEASRGWAAQQRGALHVVPNGIDAEYFAPAGANGGASDLVFTGNMWTPESTLGTKWLVQEVLPRVRARVPGARLHAVGRRPHSSLVRLAQADGCLEVHGDVPDVRPYLERAAVYVAPLFHGTGIKNRVLEAMAMGKAIVTTSRGVEALAVEPGRELLVADDAAAFADATVRLLEDPAERGRLGAAARALVQERYSWERGVARVEEILAGL